MKRYKNEIVSNKHSVTTRDSFCTYPHRALKMPYSIILKTFIAHYKVPIKLYMTSSLSMNLPLEKRRFHWFSPILVLLNIAMSLCSSTICSWDLAHWESESDCDRCNSHACSRSCSSDCHDYKDCNSEPPACDHQSLNFHAMIIMTTIIVLAHDVGPVNWATTSMDITYTMKFGFVNVKVLPLLKILLCNKANTVCLPSSASSTTRTLNLTK